MGLDVSHDAFHGAYGRFRRLRSAITEAIGGSYPPHFQYNEDGSVAELRVGTPLYKARALDPHKFYIGAGYQTREWRGLFAFLSHSDCDGIISPTMCIKVAENLEAILPKIEALKWDGDDYVELTKQFIRGCRAAAAKNEKLRFY
jgi:hypothetical protein